MIHAYKLTAFLVVLLTLAHHLTCSQSIPIRPSVSKGAPFYLKVDSQNSIQYQSFGLIKEKMGLAPSDQLVSLQKQSDIGGISHEKFQQYYKGLKVEYGIYKVHAKNGMVESISGELYQVPEVLNLQPSLSQEQALQKALAYVGAKTYKWQIALEEAWIKKLKNDTKATYYPNGELVVCKIYRKNHQIIENGDLTLAYKFDIFAQDPISRANIYVDAHTGIVIHQDAIIKHVDGTAHTRFSGQRTIATTLSNGTYRLRDASRGLGVETYNMQRGTSYGSAVDFIDNDNQWTSSEHANTFKDNAALDCHLGAMKTYDYFKNVLGRNSFDGNGATIKCYVHFGQGYENAFWDGYVMTFGDGEMGSSTGTQPLTTLDITAHEIAHAVCQYTANLVYSYESGAMNEGFSDIWGAVVEHSVDPAKATWTIGEDANFTIRSMSNPNAFQHPDTYRGQYWYSGGGDNGGVHYNSGVLNHWFYLLSVGKTGVNDNGDNYAVTGIGISKAARIAYRTESVYLTANSQYRDARTFSIQAAKDLYGATSQEAIQTANAWYAVGVYDTQSTPTNLTATTASTTQINLAWTDNSTVETGFIIERSTSSASGFIQIATVAANVTTYANTGLVTDAVYYYRVKAALGTTSSTYSNVATATVGTPPVVMTNGTYTTCSARFLDAGGTGDYNNYQYITQTFNPTTSTGRISVAFTSFDTEQGYDYLYIYDGSNTSAPLIGSYSGNTLPPTITATNTSGQLTFYFTSNSTVVKSGWQATISCVILPNTPANMVASAVSGTQINLSWSDASLDETGFVVERSTVATSGFVSIAALAANTTSYANTGLLTDNRYYYRVRAVRNGIYSAYSNVASAAVGNAPILMSDGSFSVCNTVFLDAGGTGNYENNQRFTMSLTPATAGKMLSVSFSSFNTESCCDYLTVYDGATTSAPQIGTYSGYSLPPVITASNTAGQLTFRFYSDGSSVGSGWQASVSCVNPVPPVLSSTSPLKNSNHVYRYNNISLTFSQVMQAATASGAVIKIHGAQSGLRTTGLGGSFYGAGTNSVTFDPFSDLKAGEVVSVTVTTQAKNLSGLALATPQVYQFTAAAGTGPANFVASSLSLPASPFGVAMADFDKDGDIDMASSHHSPTGGVSIRFNNGQGVFLGTTQVATSANSRAVTAADFDGDGDMDIATANQLSNDVSIRLNNGQGVFSGSTQVAVGTTPISVMAADFDGDGDMDLATANYGAGTVSVRFNNGQGLFSGTAQVGVGVNPAWLQAGDVDGDGDLDLVVSNRGSASVSVRFNNGGGVFSGTTQVAVGITPTGVMLADLDGDRDLDMATANSGPGTVSVRLNNGAGVFSGTTEVAAAAGTWAVVAVDFDGDGDMDLATANQEAGSVSVRLNNGRGVFSGTTQVAVGSSPRGLAAADVDGDGDMDIVTANYTASANSLLLNEYAPTISYFSPTSGPVGTSVTISGSNFRNVSAVKFNNVAAIFTINASYQITAIVPAGATKGRITIESLGGTVSTTGAFSVMPNPILTSFSPVEGAVGTSIILTGNNFAGISSVKINGVSANFTVNTSTQITATVPSRAATGPVSLHLNGDIVVSSSTNFTVLSGISMSSSSISTCSSIYRDPGGSSNYANNHYITQTIYPETSNSKVRLTFTSFDTEQDYDVLRVYDGSSIYDPLIGEYSGNTLPPTITATNANGYLTFRFTSDETFTGAGWQATITCAGPPNVPTNMVASAVSGTQINLSWSDASLDETGFVVERSTVATSGFVSIAALAANTTSYANTGLLTDNRYYYRVRAVRNGIYSAYSNVASAAVGNAPILMSDGSFSVCNTVFLDAGGTGNYENNQRFTMSLTPATAGKMLSVSFSSFNTESCCDYLTVYDGATTSAPQIGTYSGYSLPPVITASNTAGQLTFRFYSDGSSVGSGWQASVSCVNPVPPVLSSTSPLKNSNHVYRYNNISLTFSQVMQAATASGAVIKIHGAQSGLRTTGLGGSFYGAGTNSVTFDPFSDLKAGEVVSVTVTTQAKNLSGLALATPQVYQFTAAAGTGPANFVASSLSLPASPFGVAMADFDKDGDIDMASSHHSPTGGVSIRFNNGQGVFLGTTQVATSANSRAVTAADFDGDGDMDIATANQLSNDVSIRLNNGQGVFSGSTQVAVGTTPISVMAADFDGDGDMDLATANYGAGTVSVRFNNGQGLFSGTAQVGVGVNPAWLQAGDVDGDGDLDLVVSNRGSASVSVRFNNGGGVFSGTTQVAVGITPTGVMLADLDGDRDLDMATANSGPGTVSVRLNNGAGVFSGTTEVAAAAGTWAVVAVDFDGDGDMDLATANQEAGSVSVRLNNGRGVFSGTTQVAVGSSPRGIAAADVDGDGDMDVVTANYMASANSVLLNRNQSQSLINSLARTDNGTEQGLMLYPNPFQGELMLKIESEETQKLFVTLIDAYGKEVFVNDNHTTNMSITLYPDIPAGVYTLQARHGAFVRIFKVVKIE